MSTRDGKDSKSLCQSSYLEDEFSCQQHVECLTTPLHNLDDLLLIT